MMKRQASAALTRRPRGTSSVTSVLVGFVISVSRYRSNPTLGSHQVWCHVRVTMLTGTERAVLDAFAAGVRLDLRGRPDRRVRAEVLATLLTGGYRPGPALRLSHAVITGRLDLEGRTV